MRVEDCEARARGTFGIVVMCLGTAEVRHHAVAKVLRDMAAETLDCLRRRAMVFADDLPPLLRDQDGWRSRSSRPDRKKYRQMPPLAR